MRKLLAWGTFGLLALGLSAVLFTFFQQDIQGQKSQPESITRLRNVDSSVRDISIVETNLRDADNISGSVVIVLRNDSDKAITHISVVSGDDKESSGITFGAREGVLVPARGKYELDFPFSKVIAGFPIRVGGVMYSDNSALGDSRSLERLRMQKEDDRQFKKEEDHPR